MDWNWLSCHGIYELYFDILLIIFFRDCIGVDTILWYKDEELKECIACINSVAKYSLWSWSARVCYGIWHKMIHDTYTVSTWINATITWYFNNNGSRIVLFVVYLVVFIFFLFENCIQLVFHWQTCKQCKLITDLK